MNRTGPVEGDGADDVAAHQVNQYRIQAALDRMRAHHHDDRPLVADGCRERGVGCARSMTKSAP